MLRFEWDTQKAERNIAKHGISFEDAVTIFADPWSLTIPGPDHSNGELLLLILGRSVSADLFVVSFTERGHSIRSHQRALCQSSRKAAK